MTRLDDLFDPVDLGAEIANGYVRKQVHPTLPLAILNYAEKAQFEKRWNDVTLQCRGLVYHLETLDVLARPFPKFFNHGERADEPAFAGNIRVQDKVDGSLGILYRTPEGVAVATRGSFTSTQALHATRVLERRYSGFVTWGLAHHRFDDLTFLVEIVYPANRIVLDYQDTDDLVLLDVLETRTGKSVLHQWRRSWPGPRTEQFEYRSLVDVLAAKPRPDAEGFVVTDLETQARVKVKQEDYVRLHKIITEVDSVKIWDAMRSGDDVYGLLENVPDEFFTWVSETRKGLMEHYQEVAATAVGLYQFYARSHEYRQSPGWEPLDYRAEKKAFAERIQNEPGNHKALLFALYDSRPLNDLIWKQIKPERTRPFTDQREDIAS